MTTTPHQPSTKDELRNKVTRYVTALASAPEARVNAIMNLIKDYGTQCRLDELSHLHSLHGNEIGTDITGTMIMDYERMAMLKANKETTS